MEENSRRLGNTKLVFQKLQQLGFKLLPLKKKIP